MKYSLLATLAAGFILTTAVTANANGKAFVQDDAGLFSNEAVNSATSRIAQEYNKDHLVVFVHTVEDVNTNVKTAAQRDFARNNVKGIEIFVAANQKQDQEVMSRNLEIGTHRNEIHQAFAQNMRAKNPDGALDAAVTAALAILADQNVSATNTTTTERNNAVAPVAVNSQRKINAPVEEHHGFPWGWLLFLAFVGGAILLFVKNRKPTPVLNSTTSWPTNSNAVEPTHYSPSPSSPVYPGQPAPPPYQGGVPNYGGGGYAPPPQHSGLGAGLAGAGVGFLAGEMLANHGNHDGNREGGNTTIINNNGPAGTTTTQDTTGQDAGGGSWDTSSADTSTTQDVGGGSYDAPDTSSSNDSGGGWGGGDSSSGSSSSYDSGSSSSYDSGSSGSSDSGGGDSGGGW